MGAENHAFAVRLKINRALPYLLRRTCRLCRFLETGLGRKKRGRASAEIRRGHGFAQEKGRLRNAKRPSLKQPGHRYPTPTIKPPPPAPANSHARTRAPRVARAPASADSGR